MKSFQLDIEVTRGEVAESRHRVHAAVVGDDTLIGAARDPEAFTFWRSCAKPFQIMPLIESGGFDRLGWGDDKLALACASHTGEPEHVALAQSMLDDIELEEGDLACGPHDPLSARGRKLLRECGATLTRLHNNCSGKHAAMLARARDEGWSHRGYHLEGHPVQQAILATVSHWSGVPAAQIRRAVDGCGVVVFGLPLTAMARAWARLAASAARGEEPARQIAHAMRTQPFLVGGSDRFDTVLIEETHGRVLAKVGAEGIHSVAILDAGIGLAVKVEDGAARAQHPAVLRLLQYLGALPDTLPARLAPFLRSPVHDTRRMEVGEIRPVA
ncbi:MAG: asparaginase [Gemmatimonadaceae bacterium]